MTLLEYTFEKAVAAGTSITTTTYPELVAGAGSGIGTVSVGAGCSLTFNSSTLGDGNYCARGVSTGAGNAFGRYAANAAAFTMSFGFQFKMTALPLGGNVTIAWMRHAAGNILQVMMTTAGAIRLQSTPAGGALIGAQFGAVVPGVEYRLSIWVVGNSTTAGTVNAELYLAGSNTALASTTSAVANLGTSTFASADVGFNGGFAGETLTMDYDNVRFNDGLGSHMAAKVQTALVKPLGQTATKVGTWSPVGTSPNDGTALGDQSDTTGLSASMTSTDQSVQTTLRVAQAKTTGKYFARVQQVGAGTIIGTIVLKKGATTIATHAFTPTDGVVSQVEFDLTSGEMAAIGTLDSDWADLRVLVAGRV